MIFNIQNKYKDSTGGPLKVLSVAFTLTFLLFAILGWFSWNSYKELKYSQVQALDILELKGVILQYDEVLTMSAKMASVTGDLYWEDRYKNFEPQLDFAIKKLIAIAPEVFTGESAAKTNAANIKLVAIENEAFKLVKEGKFIKATALLSGEDYENEKIIYTAGMQQIKKDLEAQTKLLLETQGRRVFLSVLAVIAAIPLLIFTWLVTYRNLKMYVAKRKQAEEELLESEKRLSQIIHGNSIATFVIDNNHKITHWNKACENLTGVSAKEMLGTQNQWRPFYKQKRPVMGDLVVDNATDDEIAEYYGSKNLHSTVIAGAYEAEDFFPGLGKSGKWLFYTTAPLKDANGRISGVIETFQDTTERKHAEEERERLIIDLQKALAEIKTLQGILPVCCVCGLIRDDTGVEQGKGEWMKVDKFVTQKTDAKVSHSYCPKCYEKAMEGLR